jgi:hypothetical protein
VWLEFEGTLGQVVTMGVCGKFQVSGCVDHADDISLKGISLDSEH